LLELAQAGLTNQNRQIRICPKLVSLASRNNATQAISASFFAVVLICFLFPFVTVSCNEQTVAQVSGVDLVTGTTIEAPGTASVPQDTLPENAPNTDRESEIPADGRAILAAAAAIGGLVSSLIANKARLSAIPMALSLLGVLMLLLIRSEVEEKAASAGVGLVGVSVNYGIGYWGALIFFLAAIFLNGWAFLGKLPRSSQ